MASPASKAALGAKSNTTPNLPIGGSASSTNWHIVYTVPIGKDAECVHVVVCNHAGTTAINVDVGFCAASDLPDSGGVAQFFYLHKGVSVPPKATWVSVPVLLRANQQFAVRMNDGVATAADYMHATVFGKVF